MVLAASMSEVIRSDVFVDLDSTAARVNTVRESLLFVFGLALFVPRS